MELMPRDRHVTEISAAICLCRGSSYVGSFELIGLGGAIGGSGKS